MEILLERPQMRRFFNALFQCSVEKSAFSCYIIPNLKEARIRKRTHFRIRDYISRLIAFYFVRRDQY